MQRCGCGLELLNSRQALAPDSVKRDSCVHITQTVLRDFAELAGGDHFVHVNSGDALAFRGFDSECFAVKIEIKTPRGAVASAHVVKCKLLSEVAMWFGLITIAQ